MFAWYRETSVWYGDKAKDSLKHPSLDVSAQAKAQHVPLGQALHEYAGAANRERLLSNELVVVELIDYYHF